MTCKFWQLPIEVIEKARVVATRQYPHNFSQRERDINRWHSRCNPSLSGVGNGHRGMKYLSHFTDPARLDRAFAAAKSVCNFAPNRVTRSPFKYSEHLVFP